MTLSEYLKKEELQRLELSWHALTPIQRKLFRIRIAIKALPRRILQMLDQHIQHRRSKFAYLYHAHWLKG